MEKSHSASAKSSVFRGKPAAHFTRTSVTTFPMVVTTMASVGVALATYKSRRFNLAHGPETRLAYEVGAYKPYVVREPIPF